MRLRLPGVIGATALAVVSLIACGPGRNTGGGRTGPIRGQTITYWASNQGSSLQDDERVLRPELQKFTMQTGVKVKLEVIGWPDLLNRILAATMSGQGPDVLNIGNTWAASMQATAAFLPFDAKAMNAIGGRDKFLPAALTTGGAPGKTPASVPLYGLAYGLYYNKAMFAQAGLQPPQTWQDLLSDAKKLTDPARGVWGIALEAGSYTENAHFAFIFGQQHGGQLFDSKSKPTFTSPGNIAGVQQYLNLMADDKVVNPSDAQYKNGTENIADFAKGKVAMIVNQNNANTTIQADGMKANQFGVVAIPAPRPLPPGGKDVGSHVAGINICISQTSKHIAADEAFVRFMTSPDAQNTLGKKFSTIPVLKGLTPQFTADPEQAKTFEDVLANKSAPLPRIPEESQFETTVGTALSGLFARVATGKSVTTADVKSALATAQSNMAG